MATYDGIDGVLMTHPWTNMTFDEIENLLPFARNVSSTYHDTLWDMGIINKDSQWPAELEKLNHIARIEIFDQTERTYKSWEDEILTLCAKLDEKYGVKEWNRIERIKSLKNVMEMGIEPDEEELKNLNITIEDLHNFT